MGMPVEMESQKHFHIDLGNLMAFNPHQSFPSQPSSREELVDECLQKDTDLGQAIATEDVDGPLARLPPPVTKLPREKQVKLLQPYSKSQTIIVALWNDTSRIEPILRDL